MDPSIWLITGAVVIAAFVGAAALSWLVGRKIEGSADTSETRAFSWPWFAGLIAIILLASTAASVITK